MPARRLPSSEDSGGGDEPIGAYIELLVNSAPAGLPGAPNGVWTIVQWQDSAGNWQNVDGWQGTLKVRDSKRWWVDQKDFGTGPFRWVVLATPGGPVVATSNPFFLPTDANQILEVAVWLGQ